VTVVERRCLHPARGIGPPSSEMGQIIDRRDADDVNVV
jgi:hypothetical protein